MSREKWGATDWKGKTHAVAMSERSEFFVHYHGGPPKHSTGVNVPRTVEDIHLANGWAGVGYNFLVDQNGKAFEGRGWDIVGAHCPNHNRSGIGVYVAVGGDQTPSPEALATVRELYDEACERAGRALAKKGHRDGKSTHCPGDKLYGWVRDGMPVLDTHPAAAPAAGDNDTDPAPLLREGSQGRHVEALQKQLITHGQRVEVDGDFGPKTEAAVKTVQTRAGLVVDGIVGAKTRAALNAEPAKPAAAPAPKPKAVPQKLEVDGKLGPQTISEWQRLVGTPVDGEISKPSVLIERVQKVLNGWGHGLKRDGLLGRKTVMALQKYLGCRQDGGLGPDTICALQRRLNAGRF